MAGCIQSIFVLGLHGLERQKFLLLGSKLGERGQVGGLELLLDNLRVEKLLRSGQGWWINLRTCLRF